MNIFNLFRGGWVWQKICNCVEEVVVIKDHYHRGVGVVRLTHTMTLPTSALMLPLEVLCYDILTLLPLRHLHPVSCLDRVKIFD